MSRPIQFLEFNSLECKLKPSFTQIEISLSLVVFLAYKTDIDEAQPVGFVSHYLVYLI